MNKKPIIRITKEFRFEAAHALWNHDGLCKHIHGHSYVLFVTVKGWPLDLPKDAKNGMVMDFSLLKRIVNENILNVFDHSLVVNASSPLAELADDKIFQRVVAVDYQPTCENMVVDFKNRIEPFLPENVKLHSLRLHETATSYVDWFSEDNQ